MDAITEKLVAALFEGGPSAIIAILVIGIVFLYYERRRLLGEVTKKDAKIEKIIDDYYKGNLSLSDALTSLKIVLYEIKAKL
jgi:hypothetical protein